MKPDHFSENPPGSVEILKDKLFVSCGKGSIEILEIQKEGKSKQGVKAFLSGYRFPPNPRFG
jgi:methionyl-tRNA formyltransferase